MRLLLDTHIWLWALSRPDRLRRQVRRQIENPKNELYLSPVSIWEAHHLHRRAKLRLQQSFEQWLNQVFEKLPLREAPFNFKVAAESCRVELPQSDLGDLFLAATASVFDLTLVTADPQLIGHAGLKILAN